MLRTLALLAVLAPAASTLGCAARLGISMPGAATEAASPALDQKEEFLKTAKVVNTREAAKGITLTLRATLSDGKITHDASIQTIDERKPRFDGLMGTEYNFRDSYKFNIAAYRLGLLLGLRSMIPPSVDRKYNGKPASFTWWVDDVLGDEGARLGKKITPPSSDTWARQFHIESVFDQLIYNMDRNQGNTLYDKSWRLWMIDHSRAFRLSTALQNEKALERCDRVLLEKLKQLDEQTVKAELGQWLEQGEIKGLLARRDRIVARFEKLGPAALYDWLPK